MDLSGDDSQRGGASRRQPDDVAARLRNPRRLAYGTLAVLACPAVALGHDQGLASAAAVYLLVSPLLWHARASPTPSGWVERRLRGHRPHERAAVGISGSEACLTGACVLALLPLPLAVVAVLAVGVVRVAVAGGLQFARFFTALALGLLAALGARLGLSGGGLSGGGLSGGGFEAVRAGATNPDVLAVLPAFAIAWLAGVAGAIAWLGHDARRALGIALARGHNSQRAVARLATRFGRYLPAGVRRALQEAEGIAAGELDVDLLLDVAAVRRTPARRWLTICFADVVGFTRLTERLEPEEIGTVLEVYQRVMAQVATDHGGTVDKFTGDGILVLFGDLETGDRNADAAACVAMAQAMRAALPGLRDTFRHNGLLGNMEMRWGIASGTCTVGDFGSAERLHYTAIGRTVNLASRLENAAAAGEILLSERTRRLVDGRVACVPAGALLLPGIDWPVNVCRVLDSEIALVGPLALRQVAGFATQAAAARWPAR